jgi:cytochrome P450
MMLEHPSERERLAADPGLIDSAVEEFLRYDGPSNSLCRMVAVDHEIAGKPMRRGDRIFAMLNAGNRDERAFSEPDRLDLGRDPNRHLTFGQGAHFCIGAPLARLEGSLAVNALLARFPNMTLAGAEPEWRDAMIMRGMHSLRVRL